jgi:hypothetical protein
MTSPDSGILAHWIDLAQQQRLSAPFRALFVTTLTTALDQDEPGQIPRHGVQGVLNALLQLQGSRSTDLHGVDNPTLDTLGGRLLARMSSEPDLLPVERQTFKEALDLSGTQTLDALWAFPGAPDGRAMSQETEVPGKTWRRPSFARTAVETGRVDLLAWMETKGVVWAEIPDALTHCTNAGVAGFLLERGCKPETSTPGIGVETHWRRELAQKRLTPKGFNEMLAVLTVHVGADIPGRQMAFFESALTLGVNVFSRRAKEARLDVESADFRQKLWTALFAQRHLDPRHGTQPKLGAVEWAKSHPILPGDLFSDGRPLAAPFLIRPGIRDTRIPESALPVLSRFVPFSVKAGTNQLVPEGDPVDIFKIWYQPPALPNRGGGFTEGARIFYLSLLQKAEGADLALLLAEGLELGLVLTDTERHRSHHGAHHVRPRTLDGFLERMGHCQAGALQVHETTFARHLPLVFEFITRVDNGHGLPCLTNPHPTPALLTLPAKLLGLAGPGAASNDLLRWALQRMPDNLAWRALGEAEKYAAVLPEATATAPRNTGRRL